jgi:hypothetical protein
MNAKTISENMAQAKFAVMTRRDSDCIVSPCDYDCCESAMGTLPQKIADGSSPSLSMFASEHCIPALAVVCFRAVRKHGMDLSTEMNRGIKRGKCE